RRRFARVRAGAERRLHDRAGRRLAGPRRRPRRLAPATVRLMPDDEMKDFETTTFTHDGKTRDVFRQGSGPAVIVISEMPGISPKVLEFARRVSAIGCTAVVPHLFGRPGYDAMDHGKVKGFGYM